MYTLRSAGAGKSTPLGDEDLTFTSSKDPRKLAWRRAQRLDRKLLGFCAAACLLAGLSARAQGTWTSLAHTAPAGINTMLLLSDGTVMGANGLSSWYRLTPDIHGSYVNGTWTTLASMVDQRLYYSSQVLTNGNVLIAGSEYYTGGSSAELYDSVLNTWSFCPAAGVDFYDNISEKLPNGNVLIMPVFPSSRGSTIIYNVSSNAWQAGPTLYRGSYQDEASWVKLPDNSILTIDPFGTNTERFIPSLNQWVNDAPVPVPLYDPYGSELGPAFLLPNGNAIFFGSLPHTAIYTPSGTNTPGSWVQGPDYPNNQGMPDAPGAMMVSGTMLVATSPTPTSSDHFPTPVSFYEYDYTVGTTGAFTEVSSPVNLTSYETYPTRMLALPDGEVLFSISSSQLYAYQPSGAPLAEGQPSIISITTNLDGSYHLTGTLLTGISEGAAYGDDAQMDSNYPLVRMTNGSGNVYYARTYNWTSTAVMDSNSVMATEFRVPTNAPAGTYSLVAVANGNSSAPVSFDYAPDPLKITPPVGFVASGPTNGPFAPTSKAYTLTNIGVSSLSWAAGNTPLWLRVSSASGSLSPGGASASVTISLTNTATLAPGTYAATVSFTNLTSGIVQSLNFRLQVNPLVNNGGFETGSFGYWTLSAAAANSFVGDNSSYNGYATHVHSGLYGALLGKTNVLATISQNVTTTPGQVYLLSFWLSNPTTGTSNQFQVLWNGASQFNATNLPSFSFTNMQYLVKATASTTSLQFGFFEPVDTFGLDDVTLTPIVTPSFQSVSKTGANAVLKWSAQGGVTYQVQYTTNLSLNTWSNLGNAIITTNGSVTLTNSVGTDAQRFYRLVVEP